MRPRIGGLLLFASALTLAGSSCTTAGVSYVYMAIDGGGVQHRQIFYTDSSAIYCIAKFSSARADATLDFTIRQVGTYPWCAAVTDPTKIVFNADGPEIFAIAEQTPGAGVETPVAAEILPSGTAISLPCNGYITPNLPSGNICKGGSLSESGTCVGEGTTYVSEGPNSGAPGYTCCASVIVSATTTTTAAPSTIPYPAGEYTCTVALDGVEAGSSTFYIEYPPALNSCPTPTIDGKPCFCPTQPPVTGIPCYNWVPLGAVCPADDPKQICTCEMSGVWNCP